MKRQLIVITGAYGFIGSGCVRHLNDLGISELVLVDDLDESDKWKNLLGKKYLYALSKNELFSFLEDREDDISAFIHLGACSDTMETRGQYLMENNVNYSIKLFEYAARHEKRFIYASSAATYGNGSLGFFDDHEGLESLEPLNLYGFSKYYFDVWLKTHNFLNEAVGLKYFNVFGPNENHKGRMASMVYKMVPVVQKEKEIRLFKSTDPERFSDGGQKRDFIYVKDAVRMTCDFLTHKGYGIFNIGSGVATTWNDLAKAVFEALGIPPKIVYVDMPTELEKQYQNYTCAQMQKFRNLGLFGAEFSIDEAVKEYVCDYLLKEKRW